MFKIVNVKEHKQDKSSSKARLYIWPQGETIMENLVNRRHRPYVAYRKEILPDLYKQLGWDSSVKARWSQYAGCSCPCSPGFVLSGVYGVDIHVDAEHTA